MVTSPIARVVKFEILIFLHKLAIAAPKRCSDLEETTCPEQFNDCKCTGCFVMLLLSKTCEIRSNSRSLNDFIGNIVMDVNVGSFCSNRCSISSHDDPDDDDDSGSDGDAFLPHAPIAQTFRLQINRYFQFGAPPQMRFCCNYFVVFDRITLIAFAIRVPILPLQQSKTCAMRSFSYWSLLELGEFFIWAVSCDMEPVTYDQ